MGKKNTAVDVAMDVFGREIVAKARDRALDHFDQSLASSDKPVRKTAAPRIQKSDADFRAIAALPRPQQKALRRLLVETVDDTIFQMLVLLHERHHMGDANAAKLFIGKIEVLSEAMNEMAWPGIFGNLTTDRGWFTRFSKFGEFGDKPARKARVNR